MIKILPLLLGLLFVAGFMVVVFYPLLKKRLGLFLAIFPLMIFVLLFLSIKDVNSDYLLVLHGKTEFLKNIFLDFRVDGLSIIFGLLISGIGFLVLLYASWYMKNYERQGHFFMYLMLFMAAMTALVFSDNLIMLFVFWELTSVTSFLLIGFDYHLEKSRQAALQSLLITGFGGLCLLFASILIGQIAGTYQISEIISQNTDFVNHPQYKLIFLMILVAVLTKSAQFPFHFWLPGAMQAPTPVSAYLHSATMVNAGIYLLLRLKPMLGETELWKYTLILSGVITMFLGAFFSMGQKDLKRILAFTTISALGTMVLLIGIGTPLSIEATMVFFIVHGLYKGGLFMVAGIIDKSTGTRDIYVLSKLFRPLPLTSIFAILSLISMAGLPPMLGFVGKELVYVAKIQLPGLSWVILPLGVGANIMMVAISLTIFFEIFYPLKNKPQIEIKYPEKKLPWYFIAGPIVLAATSLLLGIAPGGLNTLVSNALFVTKDQLIDVHLLLWHGFNQVVLLSIFAVALGVLVFVYRKYINRFIHYIIEWLNKYHLPTLFMKVLNTYLHVANKNTSRLQHGYHRFYLMTFFLVTIIIAAFQVNWNLSELKPLSGYTPININMLLLILVGTLATIFAVFSKSRLSAIIAMGVIGYVIGLIYLLYGAIDLSITQLLVETVVMVLFVMVIYYLPNFALLSTRKSRIRDIIISLMVGFMVTLVVLHANAINIYEPISGFFAENSYLKAHGRNIVNVILVDFRALDTLGEVTVLTLAAVGVYSLFRFTVNKKINNGQ
ncbi:MAG TPA: proton-conducting transporter membrane subunit [Bacteroidales bacterium]|nr:proton-conducting transporter membrane subunit [Bacteroidales bacterium]